MNPHFYLNFSIVKCFLRRLKYRLKNMFKICLPQKQNIPVRTVLLSILNKRENLDGYFPFYHSACNTVDSFIFKFFEHIFQTIYESATLNSLCLTTLSNMILFCGTLHSSIFIDSRVIECAAHEYYFGSYSTYFKTY